MTVIACDQAALGWDDTCVECGGWLHSLVHGGYGAEFGRVCSEDCAADQTQRLAWEERQQHLHMRDLLCDCAWCSAAGLPTVEMRQEYADYVVGGEPE